jgi:tyrosyl-tRNA synthetase
VIAGYHNEQLAVEAADRWQREVGGGELPTEIPTVTLNLAALAVQLPQCQNDLAESRLAAAQLMKAAGLSASTSDAMRLIAQGGLSVYEGGQPTMISDAKAVLDLKTGMLVKAGKKKIVRLEIVSG